MTGDIITQWAQIGKMILSIIRGEAKAIQGSTVYNVVWGFNDAMQCVISYSAQWQSWKSRKPWLL